MRYPDLFITGTDTEVGKTLVSAALVSALRERGLRAAGIKPLASGARPGPEGLRNEDGETLWAVSSPGYEYADINPVALEPAIAPHIAAAEAGRSLVARELAAAVRPAQIGDRLVVEGVGGWLVPLSDTETMEDLALLLGFPVVLVVALRLGCLNHAMLTAARIRAVGLDLVGWVATEPEAQAARRDENFACLRETLGAPCLGRVPNLDRPEAERVRRYLRLPSQSDPSS